MATRTQHPSTAATFTPEMRDRQARGKTPHAADDWVSSPSSSSSPSSRPHSGGVGGGGGKRKEDYHEREKKDLAMAVLDCPEKMLMYAQANDDSIAGQRLVFLRALHCQARKDEESERRKR